MYWKGAHTKHKLKYHIVWLPKYRKRILTGQLSTRVSELLYECASFHDWKIEELNIQIDHIHILVQLKPNISLSKTVQYFKGGSSKILRKEFPELR